MKRIIKLTDESEQETRRRLLNAAGEVFSEHGFRATTVRAICHRAGANVAAVNYYFRDKQGLYREVLRFAHQCATKEQMTSFARGDDFNPEQALRHFIRHFLYHLFDQGRPAWHGRLMSREMVEPTDALANLVKYEIQPRYQQLSMIVTGIVGKNVGESIVRLCCQSIVGQCLFYHHARPMLERLHPGDAFDAESMEQRADHIFQFSLAALRGMRVVTKKKTKRQTV